jgi:FtsP/CotA-like multicopper oxidase with cupredoxin domain
MALPSPTRRSVATGFAASLVALGGPAVRAMEPETTPDGFRILRAAPALLRIRPEPAPAVDAWAFNGALPGPTLRVRHGEEVRLRFRNDTPRPLTLHCHGVRNVSAMDGVGTLSQEPVPPAKASTTGSPRRTRAPSSSVP